MNLVDLLHMLIEICDRSVKRLPSLQSIHRAVAQMMFLCKLKWRNSLVKIVLQGLTEMKCALSFCIAIAVVCVASMTCLLALFVTGKLVPIQAPDAAGSGGSLQVSQFII
jgi:hypothetical protein